MVKSKERSTYLKKLVAVAFIMLFFTSNVFAGSGDDSFYWWRVPKIIEQVKLSSSQIDQIENMFQSHSLQINDIDKKLSQKEGELKDMLNDPSAKNSEVKLLSKDVLKLKSERKELKLDMLFGIRDVLTVDQRKKLKQLKSKHK